MTYLGFSNVQYSGPADSGTEVYDPSARYEMDPLTIYGETTATGTAPGSDQTTTAGSVFPWWILLIAGATVALTQG